MIITKPKTTVEGSLGGITAAMTMRAEDMAHIMGVLTDLYSNKPLAILREYSTNARDSHVAAGVEKPIEVNLPSGFRNTLTITDHGQGMSVEDLTEVYGMFGRSTKRESNEFNGCLGLGSKSALSYGPTFTVTSVKNGVRSEVVVSRDASGLGQLTVVDTRATDEPNGTTVKIPTDPNDNFGDIADSLFMTWEPGTVLLNGKPVQHISERDFIATEGFYFKKDSQRRSYYRDDSYLNVVMGGVTYRHKMPHMNRLSVGVEVYAFVDTGAVEFVPSREALQVTPEVQKTIDHLWEWAESAYVRYFEKGIKSAQTLAEAIDLFFQINNTLSIHANIEWNGIKLKGQFNYDGRVYRARGYYSDRTEAKDSVHLSNLYGDRADSAILINRPKKSSLNAIEKKRLKTYMDNHGLTYNNVLFLGDNNHELLAEAKTIDWDAVVSETVSVKPKNVAKTGTYDFYTYNVNSTHSFNRVEHSQDVIPTGVPVFYAMSKQMNDAWNPLKADRILPHLPKDSILVKIGENRLDKFKRENPTAKHVQDYAREMVETLTKKATDDVMVAYGTRYSKGFVSLLAGKTNDPKIDLIHGIITKGFDEIDRVNRLIGATNARIAFDDRGDYLNEKYPLASARNIEHSVIYINSIYQIGK